MTKFTASVSFESDRNPVLTAKVSITATSAGTAARRAIEEAYKQFPRARYRSLVVVLEKADDGE